MSTYLEATYIGQDGHTYHLGQTYILEVQQHWFGRISVRPTHGYKYLPIEDMRHSYYNLRAFFAHWRVNKTVNPDFSVALPSETESDRSPA
jgi:hypothetical protein